jgi:hypothetical protein
MKEIILSQGQKALVDDEDFDFLSQFKWQATKSPKSNTYYASRREIKGIILMHNAILQRQGFTFSKTQICDHKNLNGLDNRKENLRISTYSQNCANVPKKKKNPTSKYKGVFFEISGRKWRAKIKKDYKQINIGSFLTEEEAALAYNEKAKELFGEFAYLNIIN